MKLGEATTDTELADIVEPVIAAKLIPVGGTAGQTIVKQSGDNYDVAWETPAGGGGGSPLDAWPVGSVFLSVVATSPATLLGGGTWVAIGAGRMLVGLDAGDADFDTEEKVGGAKTSSALLAHTHGVTDPGHTHTQDAHSHPLQRFPTTTGGSSGFTADTSMSGTPTGVTLTTGGATAVNQNAATGITGTESAGSGASFPIMPPYMVVRMWKRTA